MKDVSIYVRWLVLACLFVVPLLVLYVADWSFFPYIVGKNLAFRILTEVALGGWLFLLLLGHIPRPRLTPLFLSISAFMFVVALADAFGVAPSKSIWSNFERMDGLITLLHGFALFIVAGSLFTRALWLRFWQVSLVVSMVVGFSSLADVGEVARIAGSTGNPIYLAVYALFHIFIAALLAHKSDTRLLQWLYAVSMFVNVIVLWFTGTRGALVGLLAGVLVSILGVVLFTRNRHVSPKRVIVGLVVCVSVAVGALFIARTTDLVQSSSMLQRLSTIANVSEEDRSTSALRLMVWRIAIEGAKERPLLGWGQENFNYVFNKYYNPNMYWAEPWYDRTHNILLDWLIAAGAFGLLAYIVMYISLFTTALRSRYFNRVDVSLIAGLLAAYGVHNLFVFDHLVSYVLFFSLAGWLYTVHAAECDEPPRYGQAKVLGKVPQAGILVSVCVGTMVLVYSVNYASYIQSKIIIKALVALKQPATVLEAREFFLDAASYRATGTQEAREQFVQAAARIAPDSAIAQSDKELFTNAAIGQMQAQMGLYPHDARFPHLIASTLSSYGAHVLATPFLLKALELSPSKPSFLVALGHNAAAQRDFKLAQSYYKRAIDLLPSNNVVQQYLDAVTSELR